MWPGHWCQRQHLRHIPNAVECAVVNVCMRQHLGNVPGCVLLVVFPSLPPGGGVQVDSCTPDWYCLVCLCSQPSCFLRGIFVESS
jgi:hypothetical protein